jgi:hypothetical protein
MSLIQAILSITATIHLISIYSPVACNDGHTIISQMNPLGKANNYNTDDRFNSGYDKYAICLKTGQDVALERTPVQILTFLKHIKNVQVIGDGPGVSIGDYTMEDVVSHLYDYEKTGLFLLNF